MKKASIIGLDLAKRSFQAHGALAVSFQEVVHSVWTVNADVANVSDSQRTEWTRTRMRL